jgi:hypothetical protein
LQSGGNVHGVEQRKFGIWTIETRSWRSPQVAQRAPVGLSSVRRCGTDYPRYLPSKNLALRPFDSATVNLESVKSTWLGGWCCLVAPSSGVGGRAHVTTHRSPQGMRDCKSTGSKEVVELWFEEFRAPLPSPYLQRMEWNSIWADYLNSTHRPSRRCSGAHSSERAARMLTNWLCLIAGN